MNPKAARPDPDNNIYVARRLYEVKGQDVPSTNRPVCWAADCRDALLENPKFLLNSLDVAAKCDRPDSINICSVNIDVWESKDVTIAIEKLSTACNFNQNNPPPACKDPKNANNPVCQAFKPPAPGPSPPEPTPTPPGPSPRPPTPTPDSPWSNTYSPWS